MLKVVVIILGLVMLFANPSCAMSRKVPIETSWNQQITEEALFGGWEIHVANSESGTYSLFATVPFTQIAPLYTSVNDISVPRKGATRWFKARAYNTNGNKSEWSNKSKVIIP